MVERLFIRHAAAVITVSHSIAREYSRIYGISEPHVVLNCPNYVELPKTDTLRKIFGLSGAQKIFLYQGALATGRGIEIMLDAFSQRKDRDCVLVCMGYGPLEAMIKDCAQGSDNIFFHPAVSPDALLTYTGSADYGISFIEDLCLSYRYCLPNKLFEYLMAGIPVLVSNLVEMREFVETEGVGVVADDNSVNGFLGAVGRLLERDDAGLRNRAREASRRYCWENQETVLRDVYGSLGR
jgi:glycosyltransferase involved in cell wall biosynthesis